MLKITDLKKGTIFALDNVPYRVVEYSQKVMGRGGSIVNVKIKSLIDGRVLDKTFKGNSQIDQADITIVSAQYLYNDGQSFYFMDPNSFEQYEINAELIADDRLLIKENDILNLEFYNNKPIAVDLPKNTNLKVVYTENVVKGDTSNAVTKDAELETGLIVKVPAFIKEGDLISVDTATKSYRERVKL